MSFKVYFTLFSHVILRLNANLMSMHDESGRTGTAEVYKNSYMFPLVIALMICS